VGVLGDATVSNDRVTPADSEASVAPSNAGSLAAASAVAAALAACGGGSGSPTPPASGTSPPISATPVWSPPADAEYARFLQQAQFSSPETDIASVKQKGYAAWLDEQLALPSSAGGWDWLIARGYGTVDERNFVQSPYMMDYMVWNQIIRSPDQVRRRVALALSEYFVVNLDNLTEPWWGAFHIAVYWDILCRNAFGNFRQLLEEVTLSVAMGGFLNTLRNQKEDPVTGRIPDENYAREVMQLFAIGVSELDIDGTPRLDAAGKTIDAFTQSDVSNLARVFTGYDIAHNAGFTRSPVPPFFWTVPNVEYSKNQMKLFPERHSLLQKRFLGTTIPANTDGQTSLRLALDTLFNHPNVGPFFSRQMIQRLVTSNPSAAYVRRVATVFNNNGNGIRGDLKAVFKAILLDEDARRPMASTSAAHGKLREPMVRFAQWARTFNLTSKADTWKIDPPRFNTFSSLGQHPFRAASVFNFFRPGYIPPNTQFAVDKATAPEFQIVNESTVAAYLNFMEETITKGVWVRAAAQIDSPNDSTASDGYDLTGDYSEEMKLVGSNDQELVRRLNLLLAAGRLSESTEKAILSVINPSSRPQILSDTAKLQNIHRAVLMVMSSPEYLVQK
jgi:uncharacterized protein (DUF1800 family)